MVVSEEKNTQTTFQGKGNTVVLEADRQLFWGKSKDSCLRREKDTCQTALDGKGKTAVSEEKKTQTATCLRKKKRQEKTVVLEEKKTQS